MSTVEKPHKYADLLRAVADGKQIQVDTGTGFVDVTHKDALLAMVDDDVCRVKPDMIIINGVECPAPGGCTNFLLGITASDYSRRVATANIYFDSFPDLLAAFEALIKPFKGVAG